MEPQPSTDTLGSTNVKSALDQIAELNQQEIDALPTLTPEGEACLMNALAAAQPQQLGPDGVPVGKVRLESPKGLQALVGLAKQLRAHRMAARPKKKRGKKPFVHKAA